MKTFLEAVEKVDTISRSLKCTDFSPYKWVYIQPIDYGSIHLIRSSFVLDWEDWWLVLSEHDTPRVFHKEEVTLAEFKQYSKPPKKVHN